VNVMQRRVSPPSTFGAPPSLDGVCMQAMSRFREQRFLVADAMAAALRATAATERMLASREDVGRWVRRAIGDELTQRQQLIGAMFSSAGIPRVTPPQQNAVPKAAAGPPLPAAGTKFLSGRTLYIPPAEHGDPPPRKRNTVAALAVAVTLVVAVALGFALKSAAARRAWEAPGRSAVASPASGPAGIERSAFGSPSVHHPALPGSSDGR
jgi:hypothetical protein